MGLKSDSDSRTICKKLLLVLPGFYSIYYVASVILTGSLKTEWNDVGHLPFMIASKQFSPVAGDEALGSFLAMLVSYTAAAGLMFAVVRSTDKAWDYAVTVSCVHFVLCCLVNTAFPTNWIWWLTFALCTFWLTLLSSFSNYYLRDMRDINLVH